MIRAPNFYERAKQIAARVQSPSGRFSAKAQDKRGELFIYDDIGASWFSDGVTAKDIAAKLDEMKGVSELDVYINSPGGSVFEGVAILSLLERFDAKKTIYVDGIAASIASVIAMAGERLVMHRAATFMIHDPYTMAVGNAADLREQADVLDKLGESIVAAYQKRTGKGAKDLRDMMRAETWMTAQEALDHGFAHEIQGGEEPADRSASSAAAVSAARALTPDELVAKARADRDDLAKRFAGASPGVKQPGQPGADPTTLAARKETR